MSLPLATTYRPHRFSEVVAQPHVVALLGAVASSGQAPPAILLSGPRGTGKTSCARVYAAALNCAEEGADACAECKSCVAVAEGSSPSVLEVDAASNGGVGDIHRLRDLSVYAVPGRWRVVIIDEAQSLTREANNALLKLLEEPPPQTAFVLVTTEPNKILATVRSRSLQLEFRTLPTPAVATRLWEVVQQESLAVEPLLLVELAKRSGGHMREALVLLDQCRLAEIKTREQYLSVLDVPDPSLGVLEALAAKDVSTALRLTEEFLKVSADIPLLVTRLSDAVTAVLVVVGGDDADATQGVKALAAGVPRKVMYFAARVLWEFSDKDFRRTPPITQARLLVARLAEVFDAGSV